MTVDKSTKIKNGHSEIFLRSDGIVQVNATDHLYRISDFKENSIAIGELSNKQKVLVLVVTSKYSDIDIEARKYVSTPEAILYSIAEAYVIKSFAQKLIANFITKTKGFPVPIKFFNEITPAVEWLKKFNQGKHDRKTIFSGNIMVVS